MMQIVLFFILGLCIGSFLNVLIDRLPENESIWKERSHCDHCRKKLNWYDLVPVFSFLILGRKCRYCHKKISWQYPLIELLTGILFIFTYSMMIRIIIPANLLIILVYYLVIVSGLIAIFFTDLKYRIIPDQILMILGITSLYYQLGLEQNGLFNHILSGLVLFLMFLALVIITRGKGMGLGDVKFAGIMGFILGFPNIIISFYLSFLTGAVISMILIIAGRKKMKSTIPFGPFLVLGTFVSLFYGDRLWLLFKRIIGI